MKYWRKPLDRDECSTPVGEVHIIDDRCKGCNFCIEFCPNDVLKVSERFNVKGYHPPEVAYPEKCVACKICELLCPDFAIYVIIPEECGSPKDDAQTETKTQNESQEVAGNV